MNAGRKVFSKEQASRLATATRQTRAFCHLCAHQRPRKVHTTLRIRNGDCPTPRYVYATSTPARIRCAKSIAERSDECAEYAEWSRPGHRIYPSARSGSGRRMRAANNKLPERKKFFVIGICQAQQIEFAPLSAACNGMGIQFGNLENVNFWSDLFNPSKFASGPSCSSENASRLF